MNNFTIIAFNRLFLTNTLNILFYLIVFDELEKLARVKNDHGILSFIFFFFFAKIYPPPLQKEIVPFAKLEARWFFGRANVSAIFLKATALATLSLSLSDRRGRDKIPGKTFSIITLKRMRSYVISLQFQPAISNSRGERGKRRSFSRIARIIFIG